MVLQCKCSTFNISHSFHLPFTLFTLLPQSFSTLSRSPLKLLHWFQSLHSDSYGFWCVRFPMTNAILSNTFIPRMHLSRSPSYYNLPHLSPFISSPTSSISIIPLYLDSCDLGGVGFPLQTRYFPKHSHLLACTSHPSHPIAIFPTSLFHFLFYLCLAWLELALLGGWLWMMVDGWWW